jgi:hypothetical protein
VKFTTHQPVKILFLHNNEGFIVKNNASSGMPVLLINSKGIKKFA